MLPKKPLSRLVGTVRSFCSRLRSHPRRLVRYAFFSASALLGAFFLFALFVFAWVIPRLPNIDDIKDLVASQSSVILDREGNVLYRIHGDENRESIGLDEMSKYIPMAAMAIEDDQFYRHSGVDLPAIAKAVCAELGLCPARGGSTITQQFIKNAFLSSERTYTRKLKEILMALRLEHKYSKDQIMEMYLNRIPYGSNIFGSQLAARKFFGKQAKGLSIAESAVLAALPKAPSYYSPYGNHRYAQINLGAEEIIRQGLRSEQDLADEDPKHLTKGLLGKTYSFGEGEEMIEIYASGRVDLVIRRMVDLGYITSEEGKAAVEEAKKLEFIPFRDDISAPHFVMYVRELLEENYGKEKLEEGGLRVTTTLNPSYQAAAEKSLQDQAEANEKSYGASNASLIALDPETGQILAMVGSRDYWNDEIEGKNNVTLRPRPPGSSFKPIAYAAAFLQGYGPGTVLYDVKTNFGGSYEPKNYDGTFRGPLSIRAALASSLNIPAVKAAHLAGVPNVLDLARKLGIQPTLPDDSYGVSVALGMDARPIDMASAYGTFANGGYKVNPVAILKVEGPNGAIEEEYRAPDRKEMVLDPEVAYLINDILSDREARPGDFWRNQLTIPGQINGAKTGTANKEKDAQGVIYPSDVWAVGYTRHVVSAVWAGNSKGEKLALKADGLNVAAPIWRNFMIEAHKDLPEKPFDKPEGIRWVSVSALSGKLPSQYTPKDKIRKEVFASFSILNQVEDSYRIVEVDKVSGKLATEYTPDEAREKKAFYVHHSILPDNPYWENAVRAWAKANGQDERIPTEKDDVHTPESLSQAPSISILSPGSNAVVAPPALGIRVSASSGRGIRRVDYYWNGEKVQSASSAPYSATLAVPEGAAPGSFHTLKAVAVDQLYITSQSTVQVEIGQDTAPPTLEFLSPSSNASLKLAGSVAIQVAAADANGAVKSVELWIDGKSLGSDASAPYLWQWQPKEAANYSLKAVAVDHSGNKGEAEIKVGAAESAEVLEGDSRLISPASGSNFSGEDSVMATLFVAPGDRAGLEKIELLAEPAGGQRTVVAQLALSPAQRSAESHSLVWASPAPGDYQLYARLTLVGGNTRFTQRKEISVSQ